MLKELGSELPGGFLEEAETYSPLTVFTSQVENDTCVLLTGQTDVAHSQP